MGWTAKSIEEEFKQRSDEISRKADRSARIPSGLNSIDYTSIRPSVKSGTPSDADYVTPPPVGTMLYDPASSKIWVRHAAGTWKSVAVT